jgi:hypothetical protein
LRFLWVKPDPCYPQYIFIRPTCLTGLCRYQSEIDTLRTTQPQKQQSQAAVGLNADHSVMSGDHTGIGTAFLAGDQQLSCHDAYVHQAPLSYWRHTETKPVLATFKVIIPLK